MLNFEFPNMEICCSSLPPPHQLLYSSPVSASFCPSSSMFSILTAFLSLFPVCTSFHLLLSTFTLLAPHLPHLQAVLTTYPQACVACLCVLLSSIIGVHCIHIPSFSPHLQAVDFPPLLSAFIVLTSSFASSPESLCFSPP